MSATFHVGLMLYNGCMPAGLLAFADLLHAANRRTGRQLFDVQYVGLQVGPVDCVHGLRLNASASLEQGGLDAVLVPGFWAESSAQVRALLGEQAALVAALARHSRHAHLWSYCTGVCLLAATGKLDGKPATVTWWLGESMRTAYPKVRWQAERASIFEARVATASGVHGYLAIAQALIESNVSSEIYRELVRLMVLPRPTALHAAFTGASLMEQPAGLLRQLHLLVEELPADGITVQGLANRLGMSERTLARQVNREAGEAVAGYARRIKLNQVSERLILTSAPVTRIADELGFSSDSNLRRMFKALTGLTPQEYRQQFGRR